MNKESTLRVAILIDSSNIQAWAYSSVAHMQKLSCVEICCIVVAPAPVSIKTSRFSGLHSLLRGFSSKLFDKDIQGLDYRHRKNISNLLPNVPIRIIENNTDLEGIFKHKQVDVLVNYNNWAVPPLPAKLTYGVWDHFFNDSNIHAPHYEGFWETMLAEPEIGSSLRVSQCNSNSEKPIISSHSCTYEASIYGTNNSNYWKSSIFAARALKQIRDRGDEFFFSQLNTKTTHSEIAPPEPPNLFQHLTLLLKKIYFKTKKKLIYKRVFEQWCLLYSLSHNTPPETSSLIKLLPPKNVFWADPHIIFKDNQYYIFIEELPFSTNKGYLSVIEMDQDGNFSTPTKILEKEYHLSYPNVFKHGDEYFMIPETYDNSTIELYKCVEFPSKWQFMMNLMENVKAVDSTLHFHDNKWWLFTNISESEGISPHDELFLFYTEDNFATTNWTPHPLNPVISDVKTSRPAGKIYTNDGKTYRPSQNCSHHYGYGLNFNEIVKLSETEYEEKVVSTIEPNFDSKIIGTHTYNSAQNLTLMDAIILRKK